MTDQIQSDNGKTVAIISYITFIGWIIAFVMNNSNKTSLGAFHLRQSAMIMVAGFALSILNFLLMTLGKVGAMLSMLVGLVSIGLFILLIIGLIAAINGEEKRMPILGDMAQNLFAGLK